MSATRGLWMRCARFRPRPKRWVSKSTNSKFGARRILRRPWSGFPSGAQGLYVCPDPLVNANRNRIGILALGLRLPTIFGFREYIDPAGLMSYGPNIPDLFRRAG